MPKPKLPDWNWLAALPLLALVAVALVGLSLTPHQPDQGSGIRPAEQTAQPVSPAETREEATNDTIADATIAVAVFTVILAVVGGVQGFLIYRQIRLARQEFDASHRPWIAIRGATVGRAGHGGGHLHPLQYEVEIEYTLENTSDVPALDLLLYSDLITRERAEDIREIIENRIASYARTSKTTTVPKPQNQVVWPKQTDTYRALVEANWRGTETRDQWTSIQIGDILIVSVFIYVNPFDNSDFKVSTCVHRVTAAFTDDDVDIVKAGTGILKDANVGRWPTGWSAS